MVNKSQETASHNSKEKKQPSNISADALICRLMKGRDARIRFVDSHVSKNIAFQIQSLRARRGWSQPRLAEELGTNQNAVYRLENPSYGKPTITTLKKVAAAFDVALIVRFVPFSELVDWVRGIPHWAPGLSPESLSVEDFEHDVGRLENEGISASLPPAFISELTGASDPGAMSEIASQHTTSNDAAPLLRKLVPEPPSDQGVMKAQNPAARGSIMQSIAA